MALPVDARRLRKRMLMFYFAAGVNLLMGFWVLSMGGAQAAGGSLTVVMLVFLGFAALNFYMARKISKYLQRLPVGAPPQDTPAGMAGGDDDVRPR